MTAGDSKAALTITPQPALAPSPQPRPAPTARALPPGLVAQVGQNWTPIVGQNWMPIDMFNMALSTVGGFIKRKRETGSVSPDKFGGAKTFFPMPQSKFLLDSLRT